MKTPHFKAYPLTFKPIFKDRIWGGNKLKTELNKNIPNNKTGESWEISAVPGDVSIIDKGVYEAQSLADLILQYPEAILGTAVYANFGAQFPLLFKYLDAQQDLSIQVHPNDTLAQKRHHSFGKTEMWYVMQADKKATILVGFKSNSTKEAYAEAVKQNTIVDLLDKIEVKTGDAFLLNTGTVHAIGAGILIAEIQQSSDITYRIYDFDRKDSNGNLRELHTDLALDAINYDLSNAKRNYQNVPNYANDMVVSPFFTTKFLPLNGLVKIEKNNQTFTVYMCINGDFEVIHKNHRYAYTKGQTILIPAAMTQFKLSGIATLLEITI